MIIPPFKDTVSSKQGLMSSKSVFDVDHNPMCDILSYHVVNFHFVLRPSFKNTRIRLEASFISETWLDR
jgi:hypothetical protein